MILGMSTATFTLIHVVISLVAIAAGLLAVAEFLRNRLSSGLHGVFLVTTVATSATGFLFHSPFGPPDVIGIISLLVLGAAIYAWAEEKLEGRWRGVYVITAFIALYLNVFVGVVQSFQKIPAIHALAPKQTEPPFAIAQGIVLLAFIVATVFGFRRFHPARVELRTSSLAT